MRGAPAGEIDFTRLRALTLFEKFDGFAHARNKLRQLAHSRRDWSGYPMPLEDLSLVVEPTFPRAQEIMAIGRKPGRDEDSGAKIRNVFWSWHRRTDIIVWEEDGKIQWGPGGRGTQTDMVLNTLGAADAWGIEQEAAAVDSLGKLLRHRQFKQYLITGMFMERSKRSGVSYLFRKLRPTLAIRTGPDDRTRVLCALCMHPIGYYERSWSGAMTPTDDVIAHLMLMRGDEHMFWRRSNQHPAWRPEAGL